MKAEEARQRAQTIKDTDYDFVNIMKRITAAVEAGNFSIKIYGVPYSNRTLSTVRDLGYKVKVDEYTDTTISWFEP